MSDLQFDDYEPIERLPDDVCLELGRLIAAFAIAEWHLQRTLWQAFRLSAKAGRTLTGGMNTRSRADALVLGVRLRYGKSDLIAEVKAIGTQLEAIQGRRNEFVHGTYATSPSRQGRLFAIVLGNNSEKRARPRAVEVSVPRIAALISEVEAMAVRLDRFVKSTATLR